MSAAKQTIKAADLFCGAGGTSTGLRHACQTLRRTLNLTAVNHWDLAIKTHTANHPGATHLCQSLDAVDPRKVIPGGHLHLMVASPECTHHSVARGGKPMSDQSRASAWHVLRWAEALRIDNILIENVKEFRDWGPLAVHGRPMKSRRGETYHAFLTALRSLGYTVEDRILNAANYGDATTRERLFIMARRGNRKIRWPEPTHAPAGRLPMGLRPWKAAREIIDWSIAGTSIFDRKRPLAPATLARIEAGLRKFGGAHAEPFIVVLRRHGMGRSIDLPLPTVTAGGQHIGLCEPFVLQQQSCGAPRSVEQPLPTIATAGAISLVEPFLVTANHGTDKREGDRQFARRARSIHDPLSTLTAKNGMGLVEPFLVRYHGNHAGKNDGAQRVHPINNPIPTLDTSNRYALCEPFLTKYYGTGGVKPVHEPLDTITAKDRFGLVTVDGTPAKLDIRFRMLRPRELARAMSFDDTYVFEGTQEQIVRQIGNAVPTGLATALCLALLA